MTTIAGIASSDTNFSILVSVIEFIDAEKGTAYIDTLNNAAADLTVFAPTNAAFGQLATDLGFSGDTTDAVAVTEFLSTLGADTLEAVVTYHVSVGSLSSGDIAAAGSVTTLQGGIIDASELPTLGDNEPDLIDPSLIATDIMAENGVVHVIDRVLLPIDLPDNDAPTVTGLVLETSGAEGFDGNGADFDILRDSVIAADLAGVLDDDTQDFTVFAPTDSAFVGLSQTLGYEGSDEAGAFGHLVDALRLLNEGNDPIELLSTVLTYHVAGQSLQASQVIATGEVETLQGGTLTLDGLSLVDADPDFSNPNLIATDLQASNGVVHVLDGVLLPVDLLSTDGANDVDFVIANDGRDFLRTGRDNDLIDAKGGKDVVFAGAGDDLVLAGAQRDKVFGGSGNDTLKGEAGSDFIRGGRGNDLIDGGKDNDYLFGGRGADTFVFAEDDGHDLIVGFRSGKDKIDLSAYGFESFDEIEGAISERGFRTEIDLDDTEITLLGLRGHSLDEGDFIL
jgi:uncharacterized surface protein with fasciclin (FAS1) repeats